MSSLVYWDWARLGPMSPAAQRAQLDFVRLAAEEPSSLYFEQFLRDGFPAWPSSYQRRFPGVSTWSGVTGLKRSLQRVAKAPDDWRVLLASRSLSLVRLAARCLFRVCRNVLATDLSWPTYQHAIVRQAARTGHRVTWVSLRDQILDRGWSADDVATSLAESFVTHGCDGLFLPAVDHLGIRLPVRRIVEQIQRHCELKFILIDAAQAFNHTPLDDCLSMADFIVAGSHKWLGAYLPTGIGLFGRQRSRHTIEHHLQCLRRSDRLQDPLLHFTEQIDAHELDGQSETANVANIFACAGAAHDATEMAKWPASRQCGLDVEDVLRRLPVSGDWRLVLPAEPMRSRIVLLQSDEAISRCRSPVELKQLWIDGGCVVSAYSGGRVRISVPELSPEYATAHERTPSAASWR